MSFPTPPWVCPAASLAAQHSLHDIGLMHRPLIPIPQHRADNVVAVDAPLFAATRENKRIDQLHYIGIHINPQFDHITNHCALRKKALPTARQGGQASSPPRRSPERRAEDGWSCGDLLKIRGYLLNQQNTRVLGIAAPNLDKRVFRYFSPLRNSNNLLPIKPLKPL